MYPSGNAHGPVAMTVSLHPREVVLTVCCSLLSALQYAYLSNGVKAECNQQKVG